MTDAVSTLAGLGWGAYFQTQVEISEIGTCEPVRVLAVHRGRLDCAGASGHRQVAIHGVLHRQPATVGDWLLCDRETGRPERILERKSLFQRRAAGSGSERQLIAANVDTVFVVSSCNQDFNLARLERYLALARDAAVTPVVVLTKADLCDDPAAYRRRATRLAPGLVVETVDGRAAGALLGLEAWCGPGQTVALLGSSGVGKSTLVNSLTGATEIRTEATRVHDDRGKHTTTGRSLHPLVAGGWLVDTPGMRELQLVDVDQGIREVFEDIVDLVRQCRFSDCRHETEPGCAVQAALERGALDAARLARYRKLVAEDARNRETLAERQDRMRSFSRMVTAVKKAKQRRQEV